MQAAEDKSIKPARKKKVRGGLSKMQRKQGKKMFLLIAGFTL